MKRTLSSDQPSILQCYMKEESSLDIPTSNPIEPPFKKDKKHSTAFAKLRDYDPFVLQKIFSYCHPVDMTNSLMMVCSEWNEWYFQKKHFQGFLKEWLLERWNHLIRDLSPSHQADDTANELVPVFLTKLKDETCCEISLLKYALRWLKLFFGAHPFGRKGEFVYVNEAFGEEYKDHKSENEDQYEIEDEDDEDDEYDEEDDEEEEEWISKQGPSNSRGCNLEIIFTNYSILYKLKWKDGFFTIFDNDGGNIVNIRKSGKRDVEANFFGGFYYPDLEKCVYRRTDYWMSFNNYDKGIFGRQLSHILSLWNIFDSYCNAMNLMEILEIEGTKLTRRNYIDYNWNSGEIKQLPWEVNYGITTGTSSLYSGDEYCDIPTIMDDRCFEDFSFFVATLRAHNDAMKYLLKVAPSHFTNNEALIPFLKYSNSAFKYLHESLRHDKDKLLTMLKQNGNILKYLSSTEYENIITIDKDLVVFCVVHG
ncbi:hypothetical protein C9374_013585 [Naegleria lovaniensis]|uniref:DUF4116 domain-containing protein n=1 Tax=Naegleria lovaniensis TaxID=51637 RepID=A0AA88GZK6_NAELO|nr:uncharacterized protein C9374_013585 [Naegleria lovaniensis]KAG2392100.1 hypothetical protein C9374_013585 [Naegleria lovaniensis]